jgi:hypothetical protein
MHVRVRAGLVLGGLLLVALFAGGAVAQSAPWRIVQAGDGTLYVPKDGSRFAIVGEPVAEEELATYADGGAIGTSLMLNAPAATQMASAPQFVSDVRCGDDQQPDSDWLSRAVLDAEDGVIGRDSPNLFF